eukprot:g78271.t1
MMQTIQRRFLAQIAPSEPPSTSEENMSTSKLAGWLGVMLSVYLLGVLAMYVWSKRARHPLTVATQKDMRTVLLLSVAELIWLELGAYNQPAMAAWQWLFGCFFAATVLSHGVFRHFLVPYSRLHPPLVPAVPKSADAPPGPLWVRYTPGAWRVAALLNSYGILCHVYIGHAIRRYPQRKLAAFLLPAQTGPIHAHKPTFSLYLPINRQDATARLAIDVYLPPGVRREGGRTCPVYLNMTRYNRNIRISKKPLGGCLTRLFGLGPTLNMRTMRYIKMLAPRGYATVAVDVRGTGASSGHRVRDLSDNEVQDFKEVVRWISEQAWADKDKIAAGGISYDGTTTIKAAASCDGIKAVIVAFSPLNVYTDLVFPGGVPSKGFVHDYTAYCEALETNRPPPARDNPEDEGKGIVLPGWKAKTLIRTVLAGVMPVLPEDEQEVLLHQAVTEHRENNWNARELFDSVQYIDETIPKTDIPVNMDLLGDIKKMADKGVAVRAYAGYYDSGSIRSALSVYWTYQHYRAPPGLCSLVIGPYQHGARTARFAPSIPTWGKEFQRHAVRSGSTRGHPYLMMCIVRSS